MKKTDKNDMTHKINLARVRSSIVLSRFKNSAIGNKKAYNRNRSNREWKEEGGY